jgi:hypothetical protein
MGFIAGCSDKDEGTVDTGPEASAIKVEDIIFNPKSPAPGDTMRATAVVTASTANIGDFVSYSWTGTGGTFIETNKASVRWVAPTTSGVFNLSCKATNSVNSATGSDDVFVGELEDFIAARAGELHPRSTDDYVYYLSPPADADSGVIVRKKNTQTGDDDVVFPDETVAGTQYSFDANAQHAAHMIAEGAYRPRLKVILDDLVSATQTEIAAEQRPFPFRPNEFSSPYVSSDAQAVTYQGGLLDQNAPPSQGGVDTFAVYVYQVAAETTERATFIGDNFYPSFSSDAGHLVCVSDRGGTFEWEYFALPMTNFSATPDTIQDAVIQLTNSGGLFGSESVPPVARPFVWNPNAAIPVMAVIANNDKLWLVSTASGGSEILIDIPGRALDMVWSSDGNQLAVASYDGDTFLSSIHLVSPSGNISLLHQGEERDRFGLLSWAPGDKFIVYTVDRSGDIWYELVDADGSSSLTKPARITPAWIASGAADYGAPLMSLRPAWQPNNLVVGLFFLDEDTPRVMTLDLSGLEP